MKRITFKSTNQVCDLFNLLKVTDKSLLKDLDILLKIDFDKESALDENFFDRAAEMRMKEIKKIQDIIMKLNKKKILNQNILTIEIVERKVEIE